MLFHKYSSSYYVCYRNWLVEELVLTSTRASMLVNLSYKMSTLNAGTGTQQRLCVLTFLGSHYGTLESQIRLSFDDLTPIRLIFWNFYFVQQTLATALPPHCYIR